MIQFESSCDENRYLIKHQAELIERLITELHKQRKEIDELKRIYYDNKG